jgi:ABC-type transporter Mla maintaining outer membrane lipid asymmetry ATPase subunit MlaF
VLEAMSDLKPRKGARMVVLGTDVERLAQGERLRLLARVGFVSSKGGLISSLNAWENISLPVAYHAPERMPALLEEVQALVGELGGVDDDLLAKMPEDMTLYERRLAGYVRELIEKPELMVVQNLAARLGPTKRKRAAGFAAVYHAYCPGGTFVQLEEKGEPQ